MKLDLQISLKKRNLIVTAGHDIVSSSKRHLSYKKSKRRWEYASIAVLVQLAILERSANTINLAGHIRHKGWGRYGVKSSDLHSNLPKPLTGPFSNNKFVKEFLKGKDWSHKKSQSNHPELAKVPQNGFIENASINRARGSRQVSFRERLLAKVSNGFEARRRLLTSPRVWRNLLGSSAKSALITAAIKAIEMILANRDALINGENSERLRMLKSIFYECGIASANAFVISLVLSACIIICPPLQAALVVACAPGTLLAAIDLFKIAIKNPSKQELIAMSKARELLSSFADYAQALSQQLLSINQREQGKQATT
jgi:hypothetical protein